MTAIERKGDTFVPSYMPLDEAKRVHASVRDDLYPPTNPIVLLRAALTLRWEHHRSQEALEVLRWMFIVEQAQEVN